MPRHVFLATFVDADAPRRLDQVIALALAGISRRRARELIARGSVRVDGQRVRVQGRPLQPGQQVEVVDDELAPADDGPALPPLLVDHGDVVVVDKPAGVACEPTRQAATSITDSFARAGRPLQAVHRLDVDTSGALLLADRRSVAPWARAFHDGLVDRAYLALVVSGLTAGTAAEPDGDRGVIDAPLLAPDASGRARVGSPGKPSQTQWRVLARGAGADLVLVVPRTGRTHQIRVHLAHVGHPLVGDHRYARRLPGTAHLGLHAWHLRCSPAGQRVVDVLAPPPAAFVATAAAFGLAIPTAIPTAVPTATPLVDTDGDAA
jgi:RluA family pseudouridine synthase